jgi:hypothetical protein
LLSGFLREAAMSEIFNSEKSPVEELRDLLPGTDGFDFGTSPHGLPDEPAETYQETSAALSNLLPAKPLLMFGLTEEQCSHLAFAAKCEAEELAECYEADEHEVQEAVVHLWEAYKVLNGGRYE